MRQTLRFDEHMTSSARLSILSALLPAGSLSFMELKRATGLADGNLHVQTRKLAGSGYVDILRGESGGRPVTRFRATEKGLLALKLHVRKLEVILASEGSAVRPQVARRAPDASQVWST
jgi:DNA-binding MarR family transcriptional regulator